jgi:hypothetical protein
MKIINIDKLFEAQKLLEEVYIVDEDEVQQIKYINYETFSAKQANKKKINEYAISSTKTTKYSKPFYTLNLSVIIEKEETIIQTKKGAT